MAVELGDAHPPVLFEDQPKIGVYHENNYIDNTTTDLAPFHNVATVISTVDQLATNLSNQNSSFQVVLILPRQTESAAKDFIQHKVSIHPSAKTIVPFFLDGDATDPQIMNTNAVNECHPINSNVMSRTRTACAEANNDNITYCLQHQFYYEQSHDIGIANLCVIQAHERARLNRAYLDRCTKELDLGMTV